MRLAWQEHAIKERRRDLQWKNLKENESMHAEKLVSLYLRLGVQGKPDKCTIWLFMYIWMNMYICICVCACMYIYRVVILNIIRGSLKSRNQEYEEF